MLTLHFLPFSNPIQMGETAALAILEVLIKQRPVTGFEKIVLPPTIHQKTKAAKGLMQNVFVLSTNP